MRDVPPNAQRVISPVLPGAETGTQLLQGSPTAHHVSVSQNQSAKTDSPRPLRAVIVEDEAIIAMELEMLLEDLGIEVVGSAMSAAEAEAIVAAELPDFLTMDINIKGSRDGVEAACAIFETSGISAIFVSAFSDAATKERAVAAMPWGWVRKPVDPQDLAEAVMRVECNRT